MEEVNKGCLEVSSSAFILIYLHPGLLQLCLPDKCRANIFIKLLGEKAPY